MKKSYYLWALISVFMLTACEKEQTVDNDAWNDATELWMAGEDGSSMVGFINAKGEMVIPAKYVTCSSFSYGYAKVTENESITDFYFIDKNGNNVNAPAAEQYGTAFINGYINFKEGGKWGKMNTNWTTVIPANYYWLGSTAANGYSCFETSDGKYGYLDKNGEVVIPANFASASAFANGIAVVSVSDSIGLKDGVINEKGEYLVELQENTLKNLGEGLVSFMDSEWMYGIWDKTGNIILSATYDAIDPFTCGLAIVKKDGKYGAINTKGEVVVPVKWSYLLPFRDNVAWASMDDINDYFDGNMTWYAINTKGEQLFQLEDGETPDIIASLSELFLGVTQTHWQFHNGLAYTYNRKTGYSRYVNKSGQTIYRWNSNTGAEAPAFNPTEEDFRNAIKASMLDTEYAPLFEEIR